MNTFNNIASYLIQTLFDLYSIFILMRIILQWQGADFYNPICQAIVKLTNPIVLPLRKIFKSSQRIDYASFIFLYVIQLIKIIIISAIASPIFPSILILFIWTVFEIIYLYLHMMFFIIIISVIISWVSPYARSYVSDVIFLMSDVILKPIRKIIPNIAGLDFSPFVALILIKVVEIFLIGNMAKLILG